MQLDAPEFSALYAQNEVRADQMLLGQWIGLGGRIVSIDKDVLGHAQLTFDGGVYPDPVARLADSEIGRAASAVPGINTEVHCEVKGRTLGIPFLDNCVFAAPPGFVPVR